jgi:hypothetical protein
MFSAVESFDEVLEMSSKAEALEQTSKRKA